MREVVCDERPPFNCIPTDIMYSLHLMSNSFVFPILSYILSYRLFTYTAEVSEDCRVV